MRLGRRVQDPPYPPSWTTLYVPWHHPSPTSLAPVLPYAKLGGCGRRPVGLLEASGRCIRPCIRPPGVLQDPVSGLLEYYLEASWVPDVLEASWVPDVLEASLVHQVLEASLVHQVLEASMVPDYWRPPGYHWCTLYMDPGTLYMVSGTLYLTLLDPNMT